MIADKGYSIRAVLRRRRIPTTIPERRDQQAHRRRRGRTGSRLPVFPRTACKRRDVVDRCFIRLTQCRAIATCYDKTATSYRAMISLAPSPYGIEDSS